MKWTYKLTDQEFRQFVELLMDLFKHIDVEIVTENNPTKLFESISRIGEKDSWESYVYNIKINGKFGSVEVQEGFTSDENIETQIRSKVSIIGFMYWIKNDGDKNSFLAEKIFTP